MFNKRNLSILGVVCASVILGFCGYVGSGVTATARSLQANLHLATINEVMIPLSSEEVLAATDIPDYQGEAFVIVNDNEPFFNDGMLSKATSSYDSYHALDSLGRCGTCIASIGKDIMPTEERGAIGDIKPTGWHTVKYNDLIDGNYLYNRCHLIGYQLTGQNDNKKNLITGTRYLNVVGMLPFENMVANFVEENDCHVLYRVTPDFRDNNLVASGVMIEAQSVEDGGKGVKFCVYCYNVQPGIVINYANGDSQELTAALKEVKQITHLATTPSTSSSQASSDSNASSEQAVTPNTQAQTQQVWIPRTGKKYHSNPNCSNMKNPSQVSVQDAITFGYDPCKKCW